MTGLSLIKQVNGEKSRRTETSGIFARQRKTLWRAISCFFMVSLMTACAGPTTFDQSNRQARIDSFFTYGAAGRDLRLVIVGNPFPDLAQKDFEREVESITRNVTLMRQQTRPSLEPGPSARDNYALVFAFQPRSSLSGASLCNHATPSGAPSNDESQKLLLPGGPSFDADRVHAIAAFCLSGRALTSVSGQTTMASGDDPNFSALVAMMMRDLFRPDVRENWRRH